MALFPTFQMQFIIKRLSPPAAGDAGVREPFSQKMGKKKKIEIPIRDGKPTACIVCDEKLHRKSEYYCSQQCAERQSEVNGKDAIPFLSKWKMRKRKELRDPSIKVRQNARRKTNELIRKGKLKRKPCVVCGDKNVLPHHEDYNNPFQIIWMCEKHHKEYHDGKISLFNGKLKWDPHNLVELKGNISFPKKKYQILQKASEKQN